MRDSCGNPAEGAFAAAGAITYTWQPRRAAPTRCAAHSSCVQMESGTTIRLPDGISVYSTAEATVASFGAKPISLCTCIAVAVHPLASRACTRSA